MNCEICKIHEGTISTQRLLLSVLRAQLNSAEKRKHKAERQMHLVNIKLMRAKMRVKSLEAKLKEKQGE